MPQPRFLGDENGHVRTEMVDVEWVTPAHASQHLGQSASCPLSWCSLPGFGPEDAMLEQLGVERTHAMQGRIWQIQTSIPKSSLPAQRRGQSLVVWAIEAAGVRWIAGWVRRAL